MSSDFVWSWPEKDSFRSRRLKFLLGKLNNLTQQLNALLKDEFERNEKDFQIKLETLKNHVFYANRQELRRGELLAYVERLFEEK